MNCEWKDGVCIFCGYKLRREYAQLPHRECRELRPQCEHLGAATGRQHKVACKTRPRFADEYRCGVHRFTTLRVKSVDYPLIYSCIGCQEFSANGN